MNWRKKVGVLAFSSLLAVMALGAPALALCAVAGVGVPAVIAYPDSYSGYVVPSLSTVPCAVTLTRDGYPALPSCGGRMLYVVGCGALPVVVPMAVGMVSVPAVATMPMVPVSPCSSGYPVGVPYPGVVVIP